ncbi:MAG: hypothetical protein OXU63_18590 [Acidobacteriota bacterium]|nr:hypothetical protein [Acidobacteriota bacterium]
MRERTKILVQLISGACLATLNGGFIGSWLCRGESRQMVLSAAVVVLAGLGIVIQSALKMEVKQSDGGADRGAPGG